MGGGRQYSRGEGTTKLLDNVMRHVGEGRAKLNMYLADLIGGGGGGNWVQSWLHNLQVTCPIFLLPVIPDKIMNKGYKLARLHENMTRFPPWIS